MEIDCKKRIANRVRFSALQMQSIKISTDNYTLIFHERQTHY